MVNSIKNYANQIFQILPEFFLRWKFYAIGLWCLSFPLLLTVIEAQEKATRQRLEALNHAERFFKDRMGLEFRKLDGERWSNYVKYSPLLS